MLVSFPRAFFNCWDKVPAWIWVFDSWSYPIGDDSGSERVALPPGKSVPNTVSVYSFDAFNWSSNFFFLFLGSPSLVPNLTKELASGLSRATKAFDGVRALYVIFVTP